MKKKIKTTFTGCKGGKFPQGKIDFKTFSLSFIMVVMVFMVIMVMVILTCQSHIIEVCYPLTAVVKVWLKSLIDSFTWG